MRTRRNGRKGYGLGSLVLGFVLMVAGGYLLTNQVQVGSGPFGGFAWFGPTSFGVVLVPLLIGVALLCFNPKLLVARVLVAGGAVIVLASVLDTLRITFRPTSLFNTLLMLGLLVAGVGLLARGIVNAGSAESNDQPELDLLETTSQPSPRPAHGTKAVLPEPAASEPLAAPRKTIDEEVAEMRAKRAQQT
jgi:hypothetical protein